MLPLTEVATMRRVVKVYQQWLKVGIYFSLFHFYPLSLESSGGTLTSSLRCCRPHVRGNATRDISLTSKLAGLFSHCSFNAESQAGKL